MTDDNAPNAFRQQHGQTLLMVDLALAERIIEDDQHRSVVYYIQMRDAFHAKSEGRDSMIGRMVDGERGAGQGDGLSLADKYFAFLREFDKVQQSMLSILALPEKPGARLKHLHGMWNMKAEIREAIDSFGDWCHK